MQIHELAQQIRREGFQERTKVFDSLEAGAVLDECAQYDQRLRTGEFSKTEYGYASLILSDPVTNHLLQDIRIDNVEVRYVDNEGAYTNVGIIQRRPIRELSVATVSVYRLHERHGTRIMPDDERWGTIVGCVRDAINECKAKREQLQAQSTM